MSFGDDRSKAPAAKVSAHLRNEAEGAGAIAAFSDLDVSVMTRRREHARCRFVVKIGRALIAERNYRQRTRIRLRITDTEDVVDLTRTDEGVDFRHLSLQFIAIPL